MKSEIGNIQHIFRSPEHIYNQLQPSTGRHISIVPKRQGTMDFTVNSHMWISWGPTQSAKTLTNSSQEGSLNIITPGQKSWWHQEPAFFPCSEMFENVVFCNDLTLALCFAHDNFYHPCVWTFVLKKHYFSFNLVKSNKIYSKLLITWSTLVFYQLWMVFMEVFLVLGKHSCKCSL